VIADIARDQSGANEHEEVLSADGAIKNLRTKQIPLRHFGRCRRCRAITLMMAMWMIRPSYNLRAEET